MSNRSYKATSTLGAEKRRINAYNASLASRRQAAAIARSITPAMLATPAYLGRMSGTTQQAMRTGGWAGPSRSGASELKFVDTSNIGVAPASGVMTLGALCNGLVPGSGANNRIGRKIVMKSILLRWSIALSPTTTQGGTFRVMIVYDKQANATAPAVTDILLSANYTSQMNLSNRDRFVVLADVITDPISAGGNYSISGKLFKKLNLETMYNPGVAGTIGDITTGSLYVLIGNNGTFATAQPVITYETRVRYED